PCGAGEEMAEGGALISAGGGQGDAREKVSLRHADLCVRRDQLLLGLEDVGPPFEQRRWQARWHFHGLWLVDEPAPSNDAIGVPAHEDGDEIPLLFDPLFEIGDRRACAEDELFSLPDVEEGGGPSVRQNLCQPQRILAGG